MAKWWLLLGSVMLAGCTTIQHKPIADDPFYAPVYPDTPPTKIAPTGSIYMDNQVSSLYSDMRAHKVGDIITVVLRESTSASKSANNEIKKGSDMSLDPIYAGGGIITIGGNPIDLRYKDSINTNVKPVPIKAIVYQAVSQPM